MGYIGNQPAETPVVEILETDFKIGEDDQTKIDFADANTINFHANNAKEMVLVENSLSPGTSDGTALGTTSLMWSDLFLASGSVINLNNGDVTLTHSANTLTVAGGTLATAALTTSTIVASGIVKTDDSTNATSTTDGSLQTDGGLSVVLDAVFGDDVFLLSDSAVLNMGADNDVTFTHDGTTGLTIAANPFEVDSGGNITLDAHTGIFIFQDANSEILRITESGSGDVTIKLETNGKDLIFTDNGDATGLTIKDAAAGIVVPGEVMTTKVSFTDGDDAMTIADGGLATFPQAVDFTLDAHFDSTPSDETVSGVTATFTAGEDLVRGECVYLKESDTKMHKAVALAGSVTPPCIALAAADIAADAAGKFLLQGFITDNGSFPTYTVGDEVYTPEAETSSQNVPEATAPDSDGDLVQVLGIATGANTLYFNPSLDVIEHA